MNANHLNFLNWKRVFSNLLESSASIFGSFLMLILEKSLPFGYSCSRSTKIVRFFAGLTVVCLREFWMDWCSMRSHQRLYSKAFSSKASWKYLQTSNAFRRLQSVLSMLISCYYWVRLGDDYILQMRQGMSVSRSAGRQLSTAARCNFAWQRQSSQRESMSWRGFQQLMSAPKHQRYSQIPELLLAIILRAWMVIVFMNSFLAFFIFFCIFFLWASSTLLGSALWSEREGKFRDKIESMLEEPNLLCVCLKGTTDVYRSYSLLLSKSMVSYSFGPVFLLICQCIGGGLHI